MEDKLFRHHKVRAIEAMVASIYQQLFAVVGAGGPMLAYSLRDDDFVTLDMQRIATLAGGQVTEDKLGPATVAIDLSERLRRRDLFVRAYAFSLGMPLDPYRSDPDQFAGLERLARESGDIPRRGRVIDLLIPEMRAAMTVLDPPLIDTYRDLKPYVWLDPLFANPDSNDSARAYLIADQPGRREVLRFQDDYAETIRWAVAYILTRDAGYLFTPDDLALCAYVATEKVLHRDYRIRTPPTMPIYAKRPGAELNAARGK